MTSRRLLTRPGRWAIFLAFVPACLLGLHQAAQGHRAAPKVLLVGSTGSLSGGNAAKEEAAQKTLRSFIKDETGLDNQIRAEKGWREVADQLAKGELHIGVFQGAEFAWAKEKHPKLEPLVLGINVERYPIGYVVTKRGDKVPGFADLKGKSLGIPATSPRFIRVFLQQQAGKKPEEFFGKLKQQASVEDALDDTVDGVVDAAAVGKASLEAYKRRKPGRFKQLSLVSKSLPFPPVVIAYYPGVLDETLRRSFSTGLTGAARKVRGRTMLTLFRLTGFEAVPDDFIKVVAATQKAYPAPK